MPPGVLEVGAAKKLFKEAEGEEEAGPLMIKEKKPQRNTGKPIGAEEAEDRLD